MNWVFYLFMKQIGLFTQVCIDITEIVHIRMDKPRFMKKMAYFWPSLVENKNAITTQLFRLHFSIDCSFKMRDCVNFYLNWHGNYVRLKLKPCFL